MSAGHKAELHPDEKLRLGSMAKPIVTGGAIGGIVCLALAAVIGAADDNLGIGRFYWSFLIGFAYFLSISLGALFFTVLQHLVRARWSVVVRRLAEIIAAGTLPLMAILSLVIVVPLLMGSSELYAWNDMDKAVDPAQYPHLSHHLHGKAPYLNAPFFAIRVAVYFVLAIGIARYFFKKSVAQDESGDPAISERLRVASAPAIIVFALVTAFASYDFLMSLDPFFFSTIFGVYYFGGAVICIMATLALVSMVLQKKGRLKHSITVEHYHDLGKLMFAFVFFWSYIAFSQFMLIWYGNIPEETYWYHYRMFTDWKWLSIALLVGHCVFPFICLLSRNTKRRLKLLAFFACWMLFMHFWDMVWLILPELGQNLAQPREVDGFTIGAGDVLAWLGVGLLFIAAAARTASKVNLVPTKDPNLGASLSFENF